MPKICVITTGGTIEKAYSEQTGAVQNRDSKINRYLSLLRLTDREVKVIPVMNKDSLEMTNEDRALVLAAVQRVLKENVPIVITHGTDTMIETGLYLEGALPGLVQPIVLTGAMTPLGFEGSDGLQNLTESLLAVQLIVAGVYVVMHGTVYPVGRVHKDHEHARFVWKRERTEAREPGATSR
jgi:L-asparaginase